MSALGRKRTFAEVRDRAKSGDPVYSLRFLRTGSTAGGANHGSRDRLALTFWIAAWLSVTASSHYRNAARAR